VAKLLAPLCPFIADEIYDNLDGTLASVHLCDFPGADPARDEPLEQAMALARETVRLGLGARGSAKIKVRQPLKEAIVVADGRERKAIEGLVEIVRVELNVRRVRFVAAAAELGRYEVKANYRKLGPRFGKDMPLAADAIAALDPARVAAALRTEHGGEVDGGVDGGGVDGGGVDGGLGDGGEVDGGGGDGGVGDGGVGDGGIGITVGGREHLLSAEDVILTMRAPEGYAVEREGAHAVALELAIDDELREEGYAREIVHAVQNARKSAGLQVEDRIELALGGEGALVRAVEAHREYLVGETLAVRLELGAVAEAPAAGMAYSEQIAVEGLALTIALRRAERG